MGKEARNSIIARKGKIWSSGPV